MWIGFLVFLSFARKHLFFRSRAKVVQIASPSETEDAVHNASSVEDSENFCTDQGSNGPKAKPTPPAAVQAHFGDRRIEDEEEEEE